MLKKHTHKSENSLITLFHTNSNLLKVFNTHKNHETNIIITRINILVVINQINKHKAKIYNQCTYTPIIIKKKIHNYIKKIFIPQIYIKKLFC